MIGNRIKREKKTVGKMFEIYCKKNHHRESLCKNCWELYNYSQIKLDKCPYSINKPACNKCTIHCYTKSERDKIKEIMRFSGPRMLSRHPYFALRHLFDERIKKTKYDKKNINQE